MNERGRREPSIVPPWCAAGSDPAPAATRTQGGGPTPRPARHRIGERATRLGFRAVALCLISFNLWWFARDARPLPGPGVIGRMMARGDHRRAEGTLLAHLRRSPRDGRARMLLARSMAARGDLPGAAGQLHRVPDWWPTKREALFLEGESYLRVDRARDAEAAWRACIAADPLHPTPMAYHRAAAERLVELYATQGRWDEANAVLWGLYEAVGPADRPNVLIMRLRVEVERISAETRVARLRRFVAADPDDWESRLGLARADWELGRRGEATRGTLACIEARPDDLRPRCDLLEIHRDRGDRAGLVAALAELPGGAVGDGRIWSHRGLALLASGEVGAAADAFRRAVALRPSDEQLLYRLALAERRAGRREEADLLMARRRAVLDARDGFHDALQAYSRVVPPGSGVPQDDAGETERLASLCDALGLGREARALRSFATEAMPPPGP
ncbi:tetratricopeptide repeat protein [Tautonia plasticadhaerens]|nr:tetratricopeptide repeat protein [Tautonia plasticadhaerens]